MASKNKMKRKKRAQRRQRNQKHLRQLAKANEHYEAIQRVLTALELPDLFNQLPGKVRVYLIKYRMRSIRLELADGVKAPRRLLNLMRLMIATLLKEDMVPVMPGYGKVSLEDYFTAGFTLKFFTTLDRKVSDPSVLRAQKQLLPFAETVGKAGTKPMIQFLTYAHTIGSIFSRVNQTMYYLVNDLYLKDLGYDIRMSASLVLHRVKAEIKKVVVDGKPRPAYRVGWTLAALGMQWTKLTARDLGKNGTMPDLPMDVYIQSHALIRLRQRLDTMGHSSMHMGIDRAFKEKEITPLSGNKALVAYYHWSVKLGYLLVEIVEDIVLVRTFLFITNSGTPEGDRLDKEFSVGISDKKFLAIDKLGTFVKSDIMQDEIARNIFIRAGLEDLCNIDPKKFGNKDPLIEGYATDFVKYMLKK